MQCPLMDMCDDTIEIAELQAHCSREHERLLYPDKFFSDSMTTGANIVIIVKDHIPYIVYFFTYLEEIRLAVFCSNPCYGSINDQYKIKLSSNGKLVYIESFPIIPFNVAKHCPRCTFGVGPNRCHQGPSSRSRVDRLPKIDDQVAEILFEKRNFECKIELFRSENGPQPDINNNDKFQKIMMCYVCYSTIITQIYSCSNAHLVCENCKVKLSQCGLCKTQITISDMAVKKLYDNINELTFQCDNNGCRFMDEMRNYDAHKDYCRFRPRLVG